MGWVNALIAADSVGDELCGKLWRLGLGASACVDGTASGGSARRVTTAGGSARGSAKAVSD
jgi:hypothetical protein